VATAREIGLRMALGARPRDVLRPIVGEAAGLALTGTLVGVIAALALTRLMASLLYGVRPTDVATFLATAGVLACVAAVASYLPARRATRIDPLTALRHD
jgi:putative ABC transport system permease protein